MLSIDNIGSVSKKMSEAIVKEFLSELLLGNMVSAHNIITDKHVIEKVSH